MWEGKPIAAEGVNPAAGDAVLVTKIGPFAEDVIIEEVVIGQAPGWGCETPLKIPVGAWAGERGDSPADMLQPYQGKDMTEADLGEGFTSRRVTLHGPMFLAAGVAGWLGHGIAGPACGVKAGGASAGTSWRWEGGEWSEVDGRLVMGAMGCSFGEP